MSQKEGKSKFNSYGLSKININFMGLQPNHEREHTWKNEDGFIAWYPILLWSLYGDSPPSRAQDINDITLENRVPKLVGRRGCRRAGNVSQITEQAGGVFSVRRTFFFGR